MLYMHACIYALEGAEIACYNANSVVCYNQSIHGSLIQVVYASKQLYPGD